MTTPIKMPALKPAKRPGLLARLFSWFGAMFRKPTPKLSMFDEETVPASVPAVMRRVAPEDNLLLKPRLKPSMVPTTRLPAKEEIEQTTKVPTPPEPVLMLTAEQEASLVSVSVAKQEALPFPKVPTPQEPISLPMPTIISPRGKTRLLSILEVPTVESPMEVVSRDAATQQFHAPHLVNPTTGSKIVPPTLRNSANVIVPIRTVAPILPEDMAPKTLVQARVQDDPELMELVEEFNSKHGDEP
jgi:hypothetical protein